MNRVCLSGRLASDPIIKESIVRKTAKIILYVPSTSPNAKDSHIKCVAFGINATKIQDYAFKGTKVLIEGILQTSTYSQNGQTIYATEVQIEKIDVIHDESEYIVPSTHDDTQE